MCRRECKESAYKLNRKRELNVLLSFPFSFPLHGLPTIYQWPGFSVISVLVPSIPHEKAPHINSYGNLYNMTPVQSRRGWRPFQVQLERKSPELTYPEERWPSGKHKEPTLGAFSVNTDWLHDANDFRVLWMTSMNWLKSRWSPAWTHDSHLSPVCPNVLPHLWP